MELLVKYKAIFKLKTMLDKSDIPYEFYDRSWSIPGSDFPSYQIIVYYPGTTDRLISVIQGYGTYGNEEDLLEIMGCLRPEEQQYDTVKGWLSAKEVFYRIKDNYEV